MSRVYNFSAGPSMLPLPVLEKAASEMTDYRGSGMSVMEMSHRSAVYEEIIHAAEANLRKLMGIPDDYKVLFLQGGATTQFSAVPLNLMNKNRKADYIVSGQFSKKAADEAARYGEVNVLASSKDRNFSYVPYVDKFSPDADYVHICHNNTIFGTTYNYVPATGQHSAGCGYVLEHHFLPGQCTRLCAHLCRRAEKYGSLRPDRRHRPRRPYRQCASRNAGDAQL